MSAIDTKAFPEIASLLWRRDYERHSIQHKLAIDTSSDQIALFWKEAAQRIEGENELGNAVTMMGELQSDIDLLRGMRERLTGRHEPGAAVQLQMITRILQLLIEAQGAIHRRVRTLKDRAFQYYWLYNVAMPSKIDEKMKKDKDKEGKTSDKDVRRVLDETKQPAAAMKTDKRPAEKREKKMSP
jgi:hypothetical protein